MSIGFLGGGALGTSPAGKRGVIVAGVGAVGTVGLALAGTLAAFVSKR